MSERGRVGVAAALLRVAHWVGAAKPQIIHRINHTNDLSLAALNRSLMTDKWLHKQAN